MEQFSNDGRPRRREYSKAFKAQVVAACAQPGASVGGVALSHGLHANMVHRWIREAGPVRAQPGVCSDAEPGFISLPLLALIFSVVGIWGGSWVAVDWLGVYEGSFWANMQNSVSFTDDVLNGLVKSLVFAFVTTWIAVFQGYDCEPTSEGISRATTKTVVYASLAVLGLDFILTALMFGDF